MGGLWFKALKLKVWGFRVLGFRDLGFNVWVLGFRGLGFEGWVLGFSIGLNTSLRCFLQSPSILSPKVVTTTVRTVAKGDGNGNLNGNKT